MSYKLIPIAAVRSKGIRLSESEIWLLEKVRKFPRRIRVSEAPAAWIESEIDEWLAGGSWSWREIHRVAFKDVTLVP